MKQNYLKLISLALSGILFLFVALQANAQTVPSDLMRNCNQWKITYPTGDEDKTLCGEANNEFYYLNAAKDAIVFRAPIRSDNGTTPNSDNIRSELRERQQDGSKDTLWTTDGTHVLYVKQAITHLPINTSHLVATQIHGSKADGIDDAMVMRLEDNHLYLAFNGRATTPERLRDPVTIKTNYSLGTVHEVIFKVVDGKHYCYYSEDNNLLSAYNSGNASSYLVKDGGNDFVMELDYDQSYFKVGNYTQSNPSKEGDDTDDPNNYGEVLVYDFFAQHGNQSAEPVDVSGVSMSPSSVNLTIGSSSQLSASVSPVNAANKSVSYSTNNSAVATVNSSGVVSAEGVGSATITVTTADGGYTDTSSISVTAPSSGSNVALNKSVTATGTPDGTNVPANLVDGDPDSRWAVSGMPQSATIDLGATYSIDATEVICYGDRAYQYIIQASTNGSSYTTIVNRTNNSTNGTNTAPIVDNFSARDARYVRITVSGANSYTGSWLSLEELRVLGEATNSSVAVTGVSMTPSSTSLTEGDTRQLSTSISPSNADNQNVSYSSNNASVATVSSTGLVSAISAGSATITVTTADGGHTDSSSITVSAPTSTLPSPWATADVGAVAASGSVNYASGTFSVQGSGSDIWGSADEFRFVYQTLDGDGEVIAQVNSISNTNGWAKGGVMIRESLNAGSKHAIAVVTPTRGVSFQRRTATNSNSGHTTVSGVSVPVWVRLVRSGNTITASYSGNGSSWTQVGSATVSMSSSVYVGLCVTSHNDGTLSTASFSNVSVSETSVGNNAPYDIAKFQAYLAECKLQSPLSGTEASDADIIAGYSSSTFYVANANKIAFSQTRDAAGSSQRSELRYLDNWFVNGANRTFHANLDIVQQTCNQLTVMQIHDDANVGNGPNKPLIRVYSSGGNLYAAIKTDAAGVATTHANLGALPSGYFDCDIAIENERMIVSVDGTEHVNMDVSYWTFPNYWKNGVYLQDEGAATAHFNELTETISTVNPVLTNVALNKSVTYSAQQSTNPASNLVDGDADSRWSAQYFPQSVTIDLGSVHTISGTEVICHSDRAYRYQIQASTDGNSYSTVVNRSNNGTSGSNDSPISDSFDSTNARYVQITVTGASGYSGDWVSIDELRVFGYASSSARIRNEEVPAIAQTDFYPNPASTIVNISAVQDFDALIIYDHTGKVMERMQMNEETELAIEVDHLKPGLYIFRLTGKANSLTHRVTVK